MTLESLLDNLTGTIPFSLDTRRILLLSLVLGGHTLLEWPSGVGKTRSIDELIAWTSLDYRRIQMVSDLLSSDIIGAEIYRNGEFEIRRWPLFSEVVLIDEINRASPRLYAALLEALSDGSITIAWERLPLPPGFCVFATHNSLDDIGTTLLPFSLLDRFAVSLPISYPSAQVEVEILKNGFLWKSKNTPIHSEDIHKIHEKIVSVHTSEALLYYIRDLVAYTRRSEVGSEIVSPLSIRSSLAIKEYAQGFAMFAGRDYVLPEDVRSVYPYIVTHRLIHREIFEPNALRTWRLKIVGENLRSVPIASMEHAAYFDDRIKSKLLVK
jgi:MoxR-like ATPase